LDRTAARLEPDRSRLCRSASARPYAEGPAARAQGGRAEPPRDPIFEYADEAGCSPGCPAAACTCARGRLWADFGAPSCALLPHALHVMHLHLRRRAGAAPEGEGAGEGAGASAGAGHGAGGGIFGEGSCSASRSGGGHGGGQGGGEVVEEALSEAEVERRVEAYLARIGLAGKVRVAWLERGSAAMVTSATPRALTGTLYLVRAARVGEKRLCALLDHEVGTHFLRAYNQHARALPAATARAAEAGPTTRGLVEGAERVPRALAELISEEGLATLNTLLCSDCKLLASAAVSYYTHWRGAALSFAALFLELRPFVPSRARRWAYVFRAKRGLRDTSRAGALAKDRAYFEGAVRILERREELDFAVLHAGKVSLEDHAAARALFHSPLAARARAAVVLPPFLADRAAYAARLAAIAAANGITAAPPARPHARSTRTRRAASAAAGLLRDAAAPPWALAPEPAPQAGAAARARRFSTPAAAPRCASQLAGRAGGATEPGPAKGFEPLLSAPARFLPAAVEQGRALQALAARSRAEATTARLSRLHAHGAERDGFQRAALARCFAKRSRWGGVAFSWD